MTFIRSLYGSYVLSGLQHSNQITPFLSMAFDNTPIYLILLSGCSMLFKLLGAVVRSRGNIGGRIEGRATQD
jgi:hypothetical protein